MVVICRVEHGGRACGLAGFWWVSRVAGDQAARLLCGTRKGEQGVCEPAVATARAFVVKSK